MYFVCVIGFQPNGNCIQDVSCNIGQYHLALPNSPKKEATNICSEAFCLLRPKEKPRDPYQPISYGLVYQDLCLHGFEDIFGSIYIFRKVMMSSCLDDVISALKSDRNLLPTSTLSKKSTLASYHRVREPTAAGYLQFS